MSERDLHIIPEAEEPEQYTAASEVYVWQCILDHDEGGCALPPSCGEVMPLNRRLVRIEPAYPGTELRAIQRIEWGDWWKGRSAAKK